MLLIYIIMSVNNHNQNNSPGINNNSGHVKATPRLPPRSNVAEGFASGNQNDILTFETAPRSNEKITEPQALINANGAESDLSYHFPTNSNTNTALYPYYTGSEVDPLNGNTSTSQYNERPEANPYFLFFGKFSSTLVQNMKPNLVGHYDVSGGTVNQQPSNIYNIPDYPKDYTMFKSAMTSYNTGNNDPLNEQNIMDEFTTDKIIYDASSCPVNWRMFGPIQRQVIDWSNNGITGGGGGSGGSGGSGTGTDISFNDYFFKQPEMPLDCSFNFIPGTSTTNDTLRIHWDKPFNRKTGSSYLQTGHRYFYENLNPVENWLPQFTELILDISGGANNREFCKDLSGNFVHEYDVGQGNGGVLDNTVQKYKAYAFLSANNSAINLEATTSPSINNITVQYGANAAYGNMETTIIDHFTPNNTAGNYAGGNPRLNDIALGSTYDIAVYYRNNTKISTDPSLSPNDLYYNKHNVCLLKNIIFGIPGFPEPATGIDFWNDSATERYYLGGIGPVTKDSQNASPPGMGLNLPWTNTSIIKVGYDCSLNMTYNSGSATTHRVQIEGANNPTNNLVFNNFPILYNLDTAYVPINMADTKRNWPVGGNSSNSGAPIPLEDYIKAIDIAAGGNGRDHPEFKYEITKYNVINDTIDDTLIPPDIRKVPFSPLPITRVLPIMSRNSCNLTGFTEYENVMPAKAETPTSSSFDFLEMKKLIETTTGGPGGSTTVSQVNINAQRSRSRKIPTSYTSRQQYTDTIFLAPYSTVGGVTTKESFCLTSGNKVFKQLANFGEPKTGIITGQTYGDLIEPSAYLGSSMASATFISQVELDFQTDKEPTTIGLDWSGNFQTALIPNTADLVGWDTTFTLSNLSNVAQTISHNLGAHDFEFSVSPTFDIAETDPEITFSNKRGYYLGFDISNVMINMDIHKVPPAGQGANPYEDSATLTPSYRQHRVTLNHKVAKRNTGTPSPSLSQFVFRFATKPDDITVSNIIFSNFEKGPIIPGNSMDFTDFFGVKRLPPASSNTNSQFGGVGLELRVQFDLNNISENWIPHTSDTDSNDNIAYIEFVVGPGAFPAVNATGNLISLKKDRVSWTDNTRIGTTGTTKQIRSFLEISEALTSLSVDSGSSTYLYSRKATDIGEPLFGLKNHKFYYSNNVTGNNISIEGLSLAGRSDGFTTLQECEDFSRFVPNLNTSAPRKELFWDYTFPIHSTNQINQELPSDIDNNLKLLHIYSGSSGTGTSHNSTTLPWGGAQYDLIDLDDLLTNQSGQVISGFNTWYKHNMILPDEQSMWCNGSFVGPVSNLPLIEDPYIDYTTYFNNGGSLTDYSSKKTKGIAVPLSGTMNISGSNYVNNSVTTQQQFSSENVKWLLFEVTSLPGNATGNVAGDFSVNLQQKTGQVYSDLVLGTDYHMFYCERDAAGATTTTYQITVSGSAPKVPLSWSTWLNCLVAKGNTGPTSINAIDYANGLPAAGTGNGCNSRGSGTNFLTKPTCKGFQTNTNMRKFLLIGLFEDTKCSKITIT